MTCPPACLLAALALAGCSGDKPDATADSGVPAEDSGAQPSDDTATDGGDTGDSGTDDSGTDDGGDDSAGDSGGDDSGGSDDTGTGPVTDFEDLTPADAPAACTAKLYRHSTTAATDINGFVTLDLDLPEGRGFQVVAWSEDAPILVYEATDPDGTDVFQAEDWWSSTALYSMGAWPQDTDVVLDWPVQDADTPYEAGWWQITLATTNSTGTGWDGLVDVDVDVYVVDDGDLDASCLYVTVGYADGLGDDAEIVAAVEGAVERWTEIYAAVGISLQVETIATDLDPALPSPGSGDPDSAAVRAGLDAHQLLLVVGESIGGNTSSLLGQSANIPGALSPTERSAVAVNWLLHAGDDASFTATEIDVLGETMAHEIGHFMGLFHPIEFNSDWSVTYTDALDDTDTCTGWDACTAAMGPNLMFPVAYCAYYGGCTQEELSANQAAVLQRYAGAL